MCSEWFLPKYLGIYSWYTTPVMVPWFQMQRITNDNNYDSCCFPNLGTPRWKDYMMDIKRIIKQKHNRYPSFGISLIQNYWDNGYPGGVPTGAWSHHSLGTRAPRFGAALGEASAFAFALAFALAFPVAALALGMGMDFERASIVTDSWALSRAATVPRYVWYQKKGLLCFQSMGCSYIWSHNHIYIHIYLFKMGLFEWGNPWHPWHSKTPHMLLGPRQFHGILVQSHQNFLLPWHHLTRRLHDDIHWKLKRGRDHIYMDYIMRSICNHFNSS